MTQTQMKWLIGGVLGVVLSGAVFLFSQPAPKAPIFSAQDLNGKVVSLKTLKGKPVLINFWATSCPGCVREMPNWVDIHRKYADKGLIIVSVAMAYDDPNFVKTFTIERQLPFPVIYDADGSIAKAYGDVRATPTLAWIDPSGRWVETSLGEPPRKRLIAWIEKALSQSQPDQKEEVHS